MEEYDKTMETVEVLNTEEMAKSLMLNYAKRLRDRSNSLQWQNDAHHTLLSILEFLSGMRIEYVMENGREKARIVRVSKPQINSTGVLEIAQILSPVLNKDVIFSNLDSKEMSHFMRSYCELITFNLVMNYDEYEIDKSRIWQIKDQLKIIIETTFKRAFDARTLEHLETTFKINEATNKSEKEKTGSILHFNEGSEK